MRKKNVSGRTRRGQRALIECCERRIVYGQRSPTVLPKTLVASRIDKPHRDRHRARMDARFFTESERPRPCYPKQSTGLHSLCPTLSSENRRQRAERGLLGIAVDPNFNTNHYVYVLLRRQLPFQPQSPGAADGESQQPQTSCLPAAKSIWSIFPPIG